MERYLLNQNKYYVLAGSCESSDAESNDIPSDWNEDVDWNNHDSRYFHDILKLTRTKALDLDPEEDELEFGLLKKQLVAPENVSRRNSDDKIKEPSRSTVVGIPVKDHNAVNESADDISAPDSLDAVAFTPKPGRANTMTKNALD